MSIIRQNLSQLAKILSRVSKNSSKNFKIFASPGTVTSQLLPVVTLRQKSSWEQNGEQSLKKLQSKKRKTKSNEDLMEECGPNWELLAPRNNRFYLPTAVGPAWQGISTTSSLEAPLEALVDFEGKDTNGKGELSFSKCPSLIRSTMYELFPDSVIVQSEFISILTISFPGDIEVGARKFVLAAREISTRLHGQGYWSDFINPFSGKPFFSWTGEMPLYTVDERFRGLNMKVTTVNDCTVIDAEDEDESFAGTVYMTVPPNFKLFKALLRVQRRMLRDNDDAE